MSNFDFSKVESVKETKYLKPGTYLLSVSEVKLEQPDNKTPYLNITFSGKEGLVKQKFYLSPKSFPNLQYLHENVFGKPLTKAFENVEQVAAYFEKALTLKKVEKPFIVGAQLSSNGKLYSELPYGRFIIKDGVDYTVGEYEVGSPRYNEVVRKADSTGSASLSTDSAIIPDEAGEIVDTGDDMPW